MTSIKCWTITERASGRSGVEMMRAIRRLDCVGCESLCWIVVIVRELVPDWPESGADIGACSRLAV